MAYRETALVKARKDGVRVAILEAARALVGQGGFRAAQMSAVAAAAGVATGTIYRYFPTQIDLFAEVFRGNSQREVDAMQAAASSAGSCSQRLSLAVTTFITRALRNRRLAYALIAEPVDPQVEAERLNYRRAYARVLEAAAGRRHGQRRICPSGRPHHGRRPGRRIGRNPARAFAAFRTDGARVRRRFDHCTVPARSRHQGVIR